MTPMPWTERLDMIDCCEYGTQLRLLRYLSPRIYDGAQGVVLDPFKNTSSSSLA